ncbi:TVP38/TMEM64 family protein [Candidatus Amarobacter glycogenicus]|uniref:TVP38/TMEM64 family protein n=1 Tax=Candidatus Amarobacter glycogenicus TaxID=3140699 RepID=UPI003136660E|nr:TVP38/TMEM64 family protein [Dehalococcoidia bacterium]
MREKVIMVAALAAGLAAGAGTYALFHSKSVAGGLAVITAYLVWGELGDLFRSADVEAPRAGGAVEQPLLANPKVRRRLISLLALAGATVLILLEFVTGDLDVEDVREWIRDLGAWGPILLITVLAVAMVIAPIPNPPFMIAAGIAWGTVLGVVYSVIGQLIGSMIIFWVSRKFGRRFIPRLIGHEGADRVDRLALQMGPQLVFWWRMMPISFDFAAYAAGLTKMGFKQFITLVALGSIVPTTVVVGFGDSFGKSLGALLVTGGLIVLAMGVLGFMFYRQFKDEIGPPREALRKLLGGEE